MKEMQTGLYHGCQVQIANSNANSTNSLVYKFKVQMLTCLWQKHDNNLKVQILNSKYAFNCEYSIPNDL